MTRDPERSESMFDGSIVALATPFTEGGGVDSAALDGMVDLHLENGTSGLVVAGTTGESATLDEAEFSAMLERVLRRVDGAAAVVAGTGSPSTARTIARTRLACSIGADAALVVTPYYNRPTQAGLEAHFTAVADASGRPVLLYNVPSRTAVDMAPATTARLSAHPMIAGIKEAVPDPGRVGELVRTCGPGFIVLSGDDPSCRAAMEQGARGVVSVAANVAPAMMRTLYTACQAADREAALRLEERLRPLFRALALETNPIPVKWALFEMGLVGPTMRLPLTPLAETHRAALRECLATLGLLPD